MDALLLALLGAAAAAAFWLGLWYPMQRGERAVQRRLGSFADTGRESVRTPDLGGRRRARLTRRLTGREPHNLLTRYLERKVAKAQLDSTVGELVGGMAVLALVVSIVFTLLAGSAILGIVAGAAVPALVILWLNGRYRRIRARFAQQLADTVALLASSLRAGHSVQQALEQVAEEAPQPTSGAFALAVREIGLGAQLEQAMTRLAERYPSDDMELVTTAINVHQEIGGSLSKILDATAETIRERIRIDGDIRTLTAQQRYSAYVLALLPLFLLIALYVINPEYTGVLFEPGPLRIVLAGATALVIVGFIVMRRMATVDA